jgi:hypothetical protein
MHIIIIGSVMDKVADQHHFGKLEPDTDPHQGDRIKVMQIRIPKHVIF